MTSVYILQSLKNLRYYIGSTDNLGRRIKEHQRGKSRATQNLRPLKLVFSQDFLELREARQIEYKLKKLKNKNIVERIIKDGYIKIS